jgi:hypothetical protein
MRFVNDIKDIQYDEDMSFEINPRNGYVVVPVKVTIETYLPKVGDVLYGRVVYSDRMSTVFICGPHESITAICNVATGLVENARRSITVDKVAVENRKCVCYVHVA